MVQGGQVTNSSPGPVTLPQGLKVGVITPLEIIHVVEESTVRRQELECPLVDVNLSRASLSVMQKGPGNSPY